MNPLDYSKVFADFWTNQFQTLAKTQEQAASAMADGMQAMAAGKLPALPAMPTDLSSGAAELTRASQSMMALWQAAQAMSGTLAKALPEAPEADTTAEATFRKLADPRSWLSLSGEMDDVLGRMAEGPRFADLWDIERRYARVLTAWMEVRRQGLEHNTVVLEAWLQAGRRFTKDWAERSGGAADARAMLKLWTDTANRQLLETQRSEPFLLTQTAMIRATTELRMAQQELVEYFGKQYGFPTRTELDDVHRTVTELRREIRAMRRGQRTKPDRAAAPVNGS